MFEEIFGFDIFLYIVLAIVATAVTIVIAFVRSSYTVVPPHEAHVVVSRGKGRKVFSSRAGFPSAYWHIPILQQRLVLPLENIRIQIKAIPLRDILMAKFLGDVICFISIDDPLVAAERLGRVEAEEVRVSEDETKGEIVSSFPQIGREVGKLIEAITRNASMTMEVYEIMKHRDLFSEEVEKRVNAPIKAWGLMLVDLEVVHFTDMEPYTVIEDLEKRQSTLINAETRKQVANNDKDASIVESTAVREKEKAKAENEEVYRTRQIQKDQKIGETQQKSAEEIARAEMEANKQKIEASKTLTVGNANIAKEAKIIEAEASAESVRKKGEADADVTKLTGFAQAEVTKQQALAEAEGTEKKAVALQKYTDAGLSLEVIKANTDIQKSKFAALGEGLKVAKINLVTSGESNILGIPISAEIGADLGAMIVALQNQGVDVTDLLNKLPITETAKLALASKLGIEVVKEAEKQKQKEAKEAKKTQP